MKREINPFPDYDCDPYPEESYDSFPEDCCDPFPDYGCDSFPADSSEPFPDYGCDEPWRDETRLYEVSPFARPKTAGKWDGVQLYSRKKTAGKKSKKRAA